jgi:hypothetical protein
MPKTDARGFVLKEVGRARDPARGHSTGCCTRLLRICLLINMYMLLHGH